MDSESQMPTWVLPRCLWIPRCAREGLVIIALSQRQEERRGLGSPKRKGDLSYLNLIIVFCTTSILSLTSVELGSLIFVGYFVEVGRISVK